MSEVTTIGLDIAKNVFHAHGADADEGLFRSAYIMAWRTLFDVLG